MEEHSGMGGPEMPARRHFLDYLLGVSVVATLGAIFYPVFYSWCRPKLSRHNPIP